MLGETARVALFGTTDRPTAQEFVEIGSLTCLLDDEAIRSISWKGVEVVRAINWPVRDQSWITLPQDLQTRTLDIEGDQARFLLGFSVADDALECSLSATFSRSGFIQADLTMTATRDFYTNRAGFTLLHPIEGVTGEQLDISHPDGSREASRFPRYISPAQPAMDISGLRHTVDGITVDIEFDGEIFEMEDQRNWTDASYKTYCCPLVFPFTYRIEKGETVRQSIRISFEGEKRSAAGADSGRLAFEPNGSLPQIALATEPGWIQGDDSSGLLEKSGVELLQARLGPSLDTVFLQDVKGAAERLSAGIDLEIVVAQDKQPEAYFHDVAEMLKDAGIEPTRIVSVPEAYLKSHQPSGPWPDGANPEDCIHAARTVFGSSLVGGGMLTNFTEFNRCPPDAGLCDFLSHGTTAIVHAADDRSVCETIEALPHVFDSVINIAQGKPYRLGLVSVGMRSNPYGADVAENPNQVRQTMARFDPRQCGIFAAAFAVGALEATQGLPVEAMALAAPAGPFGIIAQKQPVPRTYFDAHDDALVYPLFHVVRSAAEMSKHPRLNVNGLPEGLHAVAAGEGSAWGLMIANLSGKTGRVTLPSAAAVRVLNEVSFADAVHDPDWLSNAEPLETDEIEVEPYTLAFASAEGAGV